MSKQDFVEIWTLIGALVVALTFGWSVGSSQQLTPGRYDFLSIDRSHGLSLAFDTATGQVVAIELPGVAK